MICVHISGKIPFSRADSSVSGSAVWWVWSVLPGETRRWWNPGSCLYPRLMRKLPDCETAQCTNYPERQTLVPDCIQLTPESRKPYTGYRPACAYRRLKEGKNLPTWHYLNTGSRSSVIKAGKSAAGRCISETEVDEDDIEDHIVRWVR